MHQKTYQNKISVVYSKGETLFLRLSSVRLPQITINNRVLKHPAFLLSRRPTRTKLSADVAYLNISCGRGDLYRGLQAAFCLRVGLSELRSFFYQRNGFKHRTIVNKSFLVNNLFSITLTLFLQILAVCVTNFTI